jgi:hypothetical protein
MRLDEVLKQRLFNMLCVTIYLYAFINSYYSFIYPVYDYYGMGWNDVDRIAIFLIFFMNLSLAFFMPIKYSRPSQLFLLIQFLVVFLPASFVCLNSSLPLLPIDEVLLMLATMYGGMCIQIFASNFGQVRTQNKIYSSITPYRFLKMTGLIAILITISAFYVLRDLFQFSQLDELNKQRELLDDFSLGVFFRYGLSWLLTVILPAIFSTGLMLKGWPRMLAIGGGTAGFIILFGLTGTKTSLLSPVIICLIFFLLKNRKHSFIGLCALFFSVLVFVPYLLVFLNVNEVIQTWFVGIVNFRILSVPQLLYSQYLDFFSKNPITYGSHINLMGVFIDYPYQDQVYKVIGDYYYPESNMTANAGMWAQDGLAGFGVFGIIIISCIFSITMMVLDAVAKVHNARWVGASMAMISMFISNASLFTTLITGGLGLMICILLFVRPIAWWSEGLVINSNVNQN